MRNKTLFAALIAVLALIAALLPTTGRSVGFSEGLTFYAFDVGQGDSFMFHFPTGENLLVDAGTRKSADSLVSKLKALGVEKIDILVATHPHEDHIGGMVSVISAFDIGKVWDSGYNHGSSVQKKFLEAVKKKQIRFGRPRAGFIEDIGEAEIEVIAPRSPISGTDSDANNNSIVLRVSMGEVSFLMMGDIEERGREQAGAFPRSTVLKLSHHGSHNGTDEKLLREAEPEAVIFSYGKNNSYKHPHKKVLKLLEKYGKKHDLKSYATVNGDIRIETDGKSYKVTQDGE